MGYVSRFICQKLVYLINAFLCSVSVFVFACFSRLQKYGSFLKKYDEEKSFIETEAENETEETVTEFGDVDYFAEEEKTEVFLKFRFPTLEEISRIQKGKGNLFYSEAIPYASTSKNEFKSGINFLEETEIFPVKEINANRIFDISEDEEDFFDINLEQVCNEIGNFHEENLVEKSEAMEFTRKYKEKGQPVQEQEEFLGIQDFLVEKNSVMDSDTELTSDGFLSDGDFDGEQLKNRDELNSDFLSQNDFNSDSDKKNNAEFITKDPSVKPRSKNSSMPDSDSGDGNKLESLWEHQELIDQLKMELRKVRATGLPTILEESESPKIMDDLKPWKIDEKFQHEDFIGELHKFYKSYRERMRKFDILNYQKMHAIGFLQLRDPLQSISKQKPSAPTLKSLVSQNLWLFKHKIHGSDPMKKFINELQGELEVVYIGQICLSWEFLHWQYEKALDLWDSNPRGIHQYNEVAGEFQQFQVLMQRFIEDEPFQGPNRVQNYVKNRCVLRNLLQVPVIREDSMKNKNKGRKFKDQTEEYTVTSGMLVEIVEESIRIFWRFIKADKNCTIAAINGRKKMAELHTHADHKLLFEVKKNLQKKERKMKDILRSENCILKRFRQCREEEDSDQVLYFFSQVDMRLVCRVLNMSKISRDQLVWCHNKLSRISFVNRKIQVQPAFLLFPC